jgi:hypothetical protein
MLKRKVLEQEARTGNVLTGLGLADSAEHMISPDGPTIALRRLLTQT